MIKEIRHITGTTKFSSGNLRSYSRTGIFTNNDAFWLTHQHPLTKEAIIAITNTLVRWQGTEEFWSICRSLPNIDYVYVAPIKD